jgi:hypothetical protein
MYCRVKLLSTDVSEVRTAFIIRDNFEHHTRRRENLKTHIILFVCAVSVIGHLAVGTAH